MRVICVGYFQLILGTCGPKISSTYRLYVQADRRAVEEVEMTFLRNVDRYKRKDQVRSDNIRQKLKFFNLYNKIQQKKTTGVNIFCVWIQE
jgi:hypothetical protein